MLQDRFLDRQDAGKKLAEKLSSYANGTDVIVLGLARGGMPVAYEVASALNLPLDVFIVRKIGVPRRPELAMGAIASGGIYYLNDEIIEQLYIPESAIRNVVELEKIELKRREKLYRERRDPLALEGKQVILVDDGLATGASMLAAIQAVKTQRPKKLIVAVPVIAADSITAIKREVDELVYVIAPYDFHAVGLWYENFGQVSDEEVEKLLSFGNQFCRKKNTNKNGDKIYGY